MSSEQTVSRKGCNTTAGSAMAARGVGEKARRHCVQREVDARDRRWERADWKPSSPHAKTRRALQIPVSFKTLDGLENEQ
jgi:hypothetical protein